MFLRKISDMSFFDNLREKYRNFIFGQYLNDVRNRAQGGMYLGSGTKTVITNGVTMRLATKTENLKQLVRDNAKKEIVKYLTEPEKFVDCLKKDGALIYRTKYAKAILAKIDEEIGFLVGQEGIYALKLNFLLFSFGLQPFSLSLKTKPMFILEDGPIDIFAFAEYYYKYLALKHKLSGLDFKSQKKFSRINKYAPDDDRVFERMSLNDLLALKEATARNIEGVNFAAELTKEYKTAKKAFDKIQDEGTNI